MAKYTLENFSNKSIEETRASWLALIDEDVFETELSPAFEWAVDHIESKDGDSVALCLRNTDTGEVGAIVEVVSSRKGTMSKMLKVIPSPSFWDVTNKREQIVSLYIDVFFNVISFGGFKSSHKVKIYGRTDEMMSILRSIHAMWNMDKSRIDFEGRFLTIAWD